MSPADEKALLQQGIAAARAGDKATARARFRELTARNFDNELAWLWLASVADTPAHAIACLRRVLQINPSHDKAKAALFRVLMEGGIQTARSGDRATAFASFSECSTIDPTSELVWTWMASTAPSPGQALDALRRVLQLNPAHDQAGRAYRKLVVQRGIDLAQANDPGARNVLLEAAQVDPENESVWLWLARAVPAEESIEYYERVLQINPAHEQARSALQQLRAPVAAPAAVAVAPEPEPELDEPEPEMAGIALADPLEDEMSDPTAMVVEQFGNVEVSQPTMSSQASTQEEFLVYQSADISTVWAPPRAAAPADADTSDADGLQDDAHEIDASLVAETMSIEIVEGEESAQVDAGAHSDVDAYLSASESTYASSELEVAAPQAMAADESDADLELNVPESEPEAIAPVAAAAEAPVAPVAAAAAVPSDAPIAWNCPICLSGAPAHAMRCPTCGSVASLLDPDLLLDTEPVDRRHVLQVVARLKNRKVSGNKHQFDHTFALGLAYLNAGKVAEGIAHLRTASGLQPKDTELKAQIDTLERRAAHRAKHASSKPAPAAAPKVNGKSTKTLEQPSVDLPMTPAQVDEPKDAGASSQHHGSNGNGSRRLILVVDDSPTIQKVVSVTLEAHGHEVVTASDGMEALSKLRTIKPDLVLLDITMPHMDGYQLCRILRSNDLTRQVPIVMLSGKDGLFDKMRGRMAGAASYITKPFAPSALPPLVEKYCKRVS